MIPELESGVFLTVPPADEHWCDLVGCERVCECGATCEDHMEDRVPCPRFCEEETSFETAFGLAANGE
jgi:hypothetical protein